jgi:hypothetical protein
MPFSTEKIIKKSMIPSTLMAMVARQRNIGLDKENFTGAFTYNWTLKETPLVLTFSTLICSKPESKIILMSTDLPILL